MDVLILHDEIGPGARPDELDALDQVAAIEAALGRLGHVARRLATGLDLERTRQALVAARADLVFNLVEAPGRSGRFIHLPIALLEQEGLAFTGADQTAMLLSSNKLAAKRLLELGHLPTPAFADESMLVHETRIVPGRYILKSVWEHGSVGLDEDSIIAADSAVTLRAELERRREALGGQGFAEAFVDGREFNLSVVAGSGEPLVLPPAEIRFVGYGPDKPKVVGYRAKWDAGSYEYSNTPRSFDFGPEDEALLQELEELARRAFLLFDLAGHARVDFRVDPRGRPFILEVNANPCIAPDAGFVAAAERAGLGLDGVVELLLEDALRRRGRFPRGA